MSEGGICVSAPAGRDRPSKPVQLLEGLVDDGFWQVHLGEADELLKGQGAGGGNHRVVHEFPKPLLKDRPGGGVVQKLPHQNLIVM